MKKYEIKEEGQINIFRGENYFLSNFFETKIIVPKHDKFIEKLTGFEIPESVEFIAAENLFQACKSPTFEIFKEFTSISPKSAKKKGRKVIMKKSIIWNMVRVKVMKHVIDLKFSPETNEILVQKLLDTDGKELLEGNAWNDCFWGVSLKSKSGQNNLGKILMEKRNELKKMYQKEEIKINRN